MSQKRDVEQASLSPWFVPYTFAYETLQVTLLVVVFALRIHLRDSPVTHPGPCSCGAASRVLVDTLTFKLRKNQVPSLVSDFPHPILLLP